MNNPSPLIPKGSMMEQKNKNRARVRIAVFLVITVHVAGLMAALLMQGCRKPPEPEPSTAYETNGFPVFDTAEAPELFLPETNVTAFVPTSSPPDMTVGMGFQPAGAGQEYTIVRGDTFFDIARKFNVTIRQIQDANPGVEPTRLQPGRKLHIPAPTAAATSTQPAMVDATNGVVYTVKSGDTLTAIARNYGVTVRALREENNLTTDRIRVGQRLKIPASASTSPAAPLAQ